MRKGFTLVEVSIVLVVIGLVIGGILLGQSMIQTAEIRGVVTDLEKYQAAVSTFQTKYDCIAGDCKDAVTYLGAGTGNGDGNLSVQTAVETWRSWQHLAMAGLLEGTYTGVAGPGGAMDAVIDVNVPSLPINGTGCTMLTFTATTAAYFRNGEVYQNVLYCGRDSVNSYTTGAFINGRDMYFIDQKIDDGKPGTGIIEGRAPGSSCSTAGTMITSEYNMDIEVTHCFLIRYLRF